MESFFIYLIKSSGIILLFLACYKFFLSRETFHSGNRYFLLSGLALALILPLITYTKTVWVEAPSLQNLVMTSSISEAPNEINAVDWTSILFLVYIIGILYGTTRLAIQLLSLRKVFRNSVTVQNGKFKLLEVNKPIQPFSFFNHIIYHPKSHIKDDIKAILAHEKIHVKQYHSVDILLVHFFAIFQWFNPFVYLYKFYLKENLEFIADAETLSGEVQKENYQYLLLKSSIGENHFPFVNPFFNSSLKKRIAMLNKRKSKKSNSIKYGLIVPLLIGFVLVFNVESVAKIRPIASSPISPGQNQQLGDPKVYSISKDATDGEIEALKKEIKEEKGKLTIENLKRNSKGEIIAISVTYKLNEGGYVTGNYDEEDNINTVHFGQNEKGGLFISTDETTLPELKKGEMPKLKKQDLNRSDVQSINKSTSDTKQKQIKNDKFNEVVYDKEKSGDFPLLMLGSNRGPLYLVNGVEVPAHTLNTISPEYIESRYTYKGKQAVRIYGEKGQHGVVDIKTKGSLYFDRNGLKPPISLFEFESDSNSIKTSEPKANDSLKVPYGTRADSEEMKNSSEKSPWKVSVGLAPQNQNKMSASDLFEYSQKEKPDLFPQDLDKALIIVEGKETSKKDFDKIPANEIESMSVLNGEAAKKKYGKKSKNGVIEIKLKKKDIVIDGADRSPLIIVDGKETSEEAMENIDRDKIKSISILKTEQAIKKYGAKAKDGAVEIVTKKE